MRVSLWGSAALIGLAAVLGGCASTGTGNGPVVAALPATPPAPPPVNYGSFLGGAVGAKLPDADRTAALAAETGALASGDRKTWKGAKGVFGYVVPGPSTTPTSVAAVPAEDATAEGAPAECRSFTSTIFFAGRPQTGHGTGCRDADGNWHVTS